MLQSSCKFKVFLGKCLLKCKIIILKRFLSFISILGEAGQLKRVLDFSASHCIIGSESESDAISRPFQVLCKR